MLLFRTHEESYTLGQTYTLKSSENITAKFLVFGAGGGGSDVRSVRGSRGGVSEGTFTFVKDQEYKLVVGSAGKIVTAGVPGGGRGGGTAGTSGRGGGGGYTGLFEGSVSHANAIIIAGGGGGSTGDVGYGGAGGGTEGDAGSNGGRAGLGGTQNGGGSGKGSSGSGSALQGGNGVDAGAGGGGYYGGGGGNPSGTISDGAGGGGSGYIHPTLITDGRTIKRREDQTNFPGGTGRDGEFRIEIISSTKTVTTTISGANTENLSITTDDDAAGVIRCKVTADDVQESPVFSGSVSYYVVAKRNVIKIEQYDYTNATATLSEDNLSDGSLSLSYDSHPGNAICLYAGEQDIDVEVDMYGGKGDDAGSRSGGEGGYSKITFTMEKDVEYVLTGLFSAVNAPFLYRKATLIAVVGGGGDAVIQADGGAGGGINVPGNGGWEWRWRDSSNSNSSRNFTFKWNFWICNRSRCSTSRPEIGLMIQITKNVLKMVAELFLALEEFIGEIKENHLVKISAPLNSELQMAQKYLILQKLQEDISLDII